ncbi:gluconokinase [Maricaulis sp. D1M11]|uniref:gluconokinase n=1 Tax=Maricaulis sp. D1M11 TaxID=3076117 RepID=UPI0039B66A44
MSRLIIIMGVSGCGKSTLGQALADRTGLAFLEGDAFHPEANVEKMSQGIALDNDDRKGWIENIVRAVTRLGEGDKILACSALNPVVRGYLAETPGHALVWVFLKISQSDAIQRVSSRSTHFMPSSLVASQFEALTPPDTALVLDATSPLDSLVDTVRSKL